MTLVFVRHGQTLVNQAGRLQGRADHPLSERGEVEADAVAAALARTSSARLVCTSPLRRARATAERIARALDAEVRVDDRLIELDYGEWDGLDFAELPADAMQRWRNDAGFRSPGGESLIDVRARVEPFARECLDAADDVIAVSHVSPIKAAVCWALDVTDLATWRMFLHTGSVTRIARRPDGAPQLLTFNERHD